LALRQVVWRGLGSQEVELQEFLQTQLQFTAGNIDAGDSVGGELLLLLHRRQGTDGESAGALWRVLPADKVPAGAELANAK
jgi:hypothetical protein